MNKTSLFLILSLSYFYLNAQTTLSCTSGSTVCPCSAGVKAEYYAGYFNDVQTYFTSNTPGVTRIDPNINFTTDNWGAIVPPAGGSVANSDNFSTRWTGSLYLAPGTYTFYLTSDDASYLWFGANALAANPTSASSTINLSGLHSVTTRTAVLTSTVGCLYDYKLHYGENTGNNRAILEYQSAALGIARQAVPQSISCSCNNIILPVELKIFYGQVNEDDIDLNWSTVTELNNMAFTVSKSTDGLSWKELGTLAGAGTSNQVNDYSLKDPRPSYGINYYLLTQTDYSGALKKHPLIAIDFSNADNLITLFPNPIQDKFTITASTELKPKPEFEVIDPFGHTIMLTALKVNDFSYELNSQNLNKGTYFIRIITPSRVFVKKLVKN